MTLLRYVWLLVIVAMMLCAAATTASGVKLLGFVPLALIVGLEIYALSGFTTHPLTYLQIYRRARGGRWARVGRGWIQIGPHDYGRADEDWRP